MSESYYDVALVCRNGHTINHSARTFPHHSTKFCTRCGAAAMAACESCGTPIRGDYHVPGVFAVSNYSPPPHCHECGQAFPWTLTAVNAAKELADGFAELKADDRQALKATVDDLVRESPQTQVAQRRFKTIMQKVGKEGWEAMRAILVDVTSEAVKKALFP